MKTLTFVLSVLLFLAIQLAPAVEVDFGPNVLVLAPGDPEAQDKVNAIFELQEENQFGRERNCILLKPGQHQLELKVGFNTQVVGLGGSPDEVEILGDLEVNARWFNGNATHNFWRAVENFSVTPGDGDVKWAVSQATSFRHMRVHGDMTLWDNGWSSGGFIADSKIDGVVTSGSQQQWFTRNTEWAGWQGGNWNMVYVGVPNPPAGAWPERPYTVVEQAPVIREKPYLTWGAEGYVVVVPGLERRVSGANWSRAARRVPLSEFAIVREGDSVEVMNAALEQGRHLLITPGLYPVEASLRVTRPGTIVMGMGYATLIPTKGTPAITVADVDGVKVCSVLLESGEQESPTLIEVGTAGCSDRHEQNPTSLHDVFTRTGGLGPGKTAAFVTIHSSDVVADHLWLWRADHGHGVGWGLNPVKNGLIVHGDNVTCYGLFVEHTQEYQVLWNGEGGRTYFYQSEFPYDPPSQGEWMSPTGGRGYASYKVAPEVRTHEAWGLGAYAFFQRDITVDSAFEAPEREGIRFHHALSFTGRGNVIHVLNQRKGRPGNPSRLED
jgi:hypothetical protein